MTWLALHLPAGPSSPTPEALACWAGRFTSRLSVTADSLRLDIGASLRLFGGLDALVDAVERDLADMNIAALPAVAATPLAAAWLARAQRPTRCPDLQTTRAALRELPLHGLGFSQSVQRRLVRFGLQRLGEVVDLPRGGLGRRVGKAFILDLDRAWGELPDPQRDYVFPDTFVQALELPAPVHAAPILQFAARRLIVSLAGWLAVRRRAVRELAWRIDHGHGEVTALDLRFSRPVWAAARIERVLQERLASLSLAAPALGLELVAKHSEPVVEVAEVLFDGTAAAPASGHESYADLYDRLRARLGESAVQGLACHADYRPEAASISEGASFLAAPARRPLWLLTEPQALQEMNGRPQYRGNLQLLAGPERIESGWWDGGDVRRDYFIALDRQGCWLWLFRDPGIPGWFLHGFFA